MMKLKLIYFAAFAFLLPGAFASTFEDFGGTYKGTYTASLNLDELTYDSGKNKNLARARIKISNYKKVLTMLLSWNGHPDSTSYTTRFRFNLKGRNKAHNDTTNDIYLGSNVEIYDDGEIELYRDKGIGICKSIGKTVRYTGYSYLELTDSERNYPLSRIKVQMRLFPSPQRGKTRLLITVNLRSDETYQFQFSLYK